MTPFSSSSYMRRLSLLSLWERMWKWRNEMKLIKVFFLCNFSLTRPKSPVFPALITESLVFSNSLLNDVGKEKRKKNEMRQRPTRIDQRKWNIGWKKQKREESRRRKQFPEDLSTLRLHCGVIEKSSWLDESEKIASTLLYVNWLTYAINWHTTLTFNTLVMRWDWLDCPCSTAR